MTSWPANAKSRASESPYAALRPADTGRSPVGFAETYSTLTRCGGFAVPPPKPPSRARPRGRGQLLGDLARRPAQWLREPHGERRRVVAVLRVRGPLERRVGAGR